MTKKVHVGIIGGAGYTGGETIRLIINHPHTELVFVHSRSQSGKPLHTAHPDLLGDTEHQFTEKVRSDVDLLFLCLGHGESKKFLEENSFPDSIKIIDLSHDYRLGQMLDGKGFVYGLPELNREKVKSATHVANPGCFATAIQLGVLPLAAHGLLDSIYTTGITGSSGAGQKLQDTTHFTWRSNNISPYKTLTHQHLGEINRALKQVQPNYSDGLSFIPWRGDFTRGIFVSSVITTAKSLEEISTIYKTFYNDHPFTHVSDGMIDLKQVVNSNKALIHLEQEGNKLVIHTAIDNLLKGAAGQAVQNMNLMFGLDETAGLKLKGVVF